MDKVDNLEWKRNISKGISEKYKNANCSEEYFEKIRRKKSVKRWKMLQKKREEGFCSEITKKGWETRRKKQRLLIQLVEREKVCGVLKKGAEE